jgi:hypothetical protein
MDLAEYASSPAIGPVSSFPAQFLYNTPGELSKGANAGCTVNGHHARSSSGRPPQSAGALHKKFKNVNINSNKYKFVILSSLSIAPVLALNKYISDSYHVWHAN